jgi:uncharacterized repeat protein (TIGR01451 family)
MPELLWGFAGDFMYNKGIVYSIVAFCFAWGATCASSEEKGSPATRGGERLQVMSGYGHLPLAFEPNLGQAESGVQFISHGPGYALSFTANEAWLRLQRTAPSASAPDLTRAGNFKSFRDSESSALLGMQLVGARKNAGVAALERLPGVSHYYFGNAPGRSHTFVPQFGKVKYSGVYPGIDLVYYSRDGHLECDFRVAPGASPALIRWQIKGTQQLSISARGDLIAEIDGGSVELRKPEIYQRLHGIRRNVAGSYRVSSGEVQFRISAYDTRRPLVIDPVLRYSTFLGSNTSRSVAVDQNGQAYVIIDQSVSKLNAAGSALLYSTHLDGLTGSLAIDHSGNAYVSGFGAFVAKLSPQGTLLMHSAPIASSSVYVSGIAVDASGNSYITGFASALTTTAGAFQRSCPSSECAFVAKFNSAGDLVYSTFLGGSAPTFAFGLAVDNLGNAFVAGDTTSSDFPVTPNAFQKTFSGVGDAFVTKFNSTGSALMYSTYLGGSGEESARGIAVDRSGSAYIVGITRSFRDFPVTPGTLEPHYTPCCDDAFVSKLSSDGSKLVYSSFLGGNNVDNADAIAVDQYNQAYITGRTRSSNFPQTANRLQGLAGTGFDAFILTLNAAGSSIVYYSTFLGGTGDDDALGVAVDPALNVFVTGVTYGSDFPVTPGAFRTTSPSSVSNAGFLSKLVIAADLSTTTGAPTSVSSGANLTYTFSVFNKGPDGSDVAVLTSSIPAGTKFVGFTNTNGTCSIPAVGGTGPFTCKRSSRLLQNHAWGPVTLTVKVTASPGTTVTNSVAAKANTQDLVLSNNSATAKTAVR